MNYFVILVFVLLPLAGLILGARKLLLVTRGRRIVARIVAYESRHSDASSDASTLRLPVVEFTDEAGGRVRITMSSEAPGRRGDSDEVKLVHPRGRPGAAAYDDPLALWLVPAFCFGPALVFIAYFAIAYGVSRLPGGL